MESDENASLNRFINLETPVLTQAYANACIAATKALNEGAPIPSVSASDFRQLWRATRRMHAEIPAEPNVAIGVSILAAYGVDFVHEPVRFMAAQWRCTVLSKLLERSVLNAYCHGEEPDEKVFSAAATIPLTKEDLGEVMLPQILAQAPADFVAQARELMQAQGYDPARPNIDSKFLRWLQEKC